MAQLKLSISFTAEDEDLYDLLKAKKNCSSYIRRLILQDLFETKGVGLPKVEKDKVDKVIENRKKLKNNIKFK